MAETKDRHDGGKSSGLRPVTVRFSPDAWRAIRDVAAEHGITQAELVRYAVAGNLYRYLGNVKYIDPKQGEEIQKLVQALMDEVSKVQFELHRIGVNYNQEVKLKAIERKYRNDTVGKILNEKKEKDAVLNDSNNLSKTELEAIMKRYEMATKEVGELLCRILQ